MTQSQFDERKAYAQAMSGMSDEEVAADFDNEYSDDIKSDYDEANDIFAKPTEKKPSSGGSGNNGDSSDDTTSEEEIIRNLIAELALSYEGSTDWNTDTEKDNFPNPSYKCNKFVYDILNEAGASPGLPKGNLLKRILGLGYPPTASDWANPDFKIKGWKVLSSSEKPKPGDVVAEDINYSDATGHVAIVTKDNKSTGTSGSQNAITEYDFGFSDEEDGIPVFRRWVGYD